MKINRLRIPSALFCCFVCGNLLAMKELQSTVTKKKTIVFAGNEFHVSPKILKNFGSYGTEISKQKQVILSLIREFLPEKEKEPKDKLIELILENKLAQEWNITHYIKSILSEENEASQSNLVRLMLTVALKGIIPPEAQDKKTLFTIIKMANFLGNTNLMKPCILPLMKKLLDEKTFKLLFVRAYKILPPPAIHVPFPYYLIEVEDNGKKKTGYFDIYDKTCIPFFGSNILPEGNQFLEIKDNGKGEIALFNINPFKDNPTFEQIELCYNIFSGENQTKDLDKYDTELFKSLPKLLQNLAKRVAMKSICSRCYLLDPNQML